MSRSVGRCHCSAHQPSIVDAGGSTPASRETRKLTLSDFSEFHARETLWTQGGHSLSKKVGKAKPVFRPFTNCGPVCGNPISVLHGGVRSQKLVVKETSFEWRCGIVVLGAEKLRRNWSGCPGKNGVRMRRRCISRPLLKETFKVYQAHPTEP